MPEPAKTPIAPRNDSGTWPASSSASHAHLEEMAVLRVDDRRFAGAEAEEPGVEELHVRRAARRP